MRTLQEIQPGQTLGRYEFLVPIAEGGMASVWAARLKGTRGFSKTVAVKTMLPSVSDDATFEQMFLDEAQIASRIRHPNVVEILDLGEQDEVLYLVMEWVDGEPLANLRRAAAKGGGIPRPIAVRLVADCCAGLHAAHELKDDAGQLVGLVHRDISPQNVLITFDGVVKIVDFGVAKAAGRSSGQTTAGQVKGKPPYMSPEQALGESVDRRTDVFALGIILYQLTTGKHPFRGESDLVTLQNIVSDKPIVPPRAYDKQYPRELENIVMKALDRNRDRRFQSCAEFEAAFDAVFAKEIPRARTEDVGKFMRECLGSRGEARRKALADSIRMADERAAGRGSLAEMALPARPLSPGDPSVSLTPSSGTLSVEPRLQGAEPLLRTGSTDSQVAPVTPFGATFPSPSSRRSKGILFSGLAVVALAGGALAFWPHQALPTSPETGAGAHPPVVTAPAPAPPPVVTAPPEPPAEPPPQATTDVVDSPEPVPQTKAATSRPKGHAAPTASHAVPVTTKPVAATKPAAGGKPAPKSGFVPPPVSDPGF